MFLFIHFFAIRQTILDTSFYWIERNLILGVISNTILSVFLYKYQVINLIPKSELIIMFVGAFCFPMMLFYLYFNFLKKYSNLYKNGYFKLICNNKFIV